MKLHSSIFKNVLFGLLNFLNYFLKLWKKESQSRYVRTDLRKKIYVSILFLLSLYIHLLLFYWKKWWQLFWNFFDCFFAALLLKLVWDRICFTEKMMATLVESSGLLFLQHHYSKRTSDLALLSAQRKLNLFQNSKQQKILK